MRALTISDVAARDEACLDRYLSACERAEERAEAEYEADNGYFAALLAYVDEQVACQELHC